MQCGLKSNLQIRVLSHIAGADVNYLIHFCNIWKI